MVKHKKTDFLEKEKQSKPDDLSFYKTVGSGLPTVTVSSAISALVS